MQFQYSQGTCLKLIGLYLEDSSITVRIKGIYNNFREINILHSSDLEIRLLLQGQ